jgi:hypothetical protein
VVALSFALSSSPAQAVNDNPETKSNDVTVFVLAMRWNILISGWPGVL